MRSDKKSVSPPAEPSVARRGFEARKQKPLTFYEDECTFLLLNFLADLKKRLRGFYLTRKGDHRLEKWHLRRTYRQGLGVRFKKHILSYVWTITNIQSGTPRTWTAGDILLWLYQWPITTRRRSLCVDYHTSRSCQKRKLTRHHTKLIKLSSSLKFFVKNHTQLTQQRC